MTPDHENPFSISIANSLRNLAGQFAEVLEELKRTAEPAAENFRLVVEGLSELYRQSQLIGNAGFVPHPTMPQNLIRQSSGDAKRLSELFEQYYRERWVDVRDSMIKQVNSYRIDDEAKEVFREGVILHGKAHYRLVVRLLFPEIERMARRELYEDKLGRIYNVQEGFSELIRKLPFPDLDPSWFFGFTQLKLLNEHLYIKVKDRNRKQIEADPVPNRHAAVHGLVVYRTAKNSLNTIFMTDFIYQVVTTVKIRYGLSP
jgi:hypothetical protein